MQSIAQANEFQPIKPTGPATRRPREIRDKARKPKPNPRSSWPSWVDDFAVTIVEDTEDFRPTARPDFAPSPLDEAEWSGFTVALSGEPLAEIPTQDTSIALRWAIGQLHGLQARHDQERADREHDAWVDQQYMERMTAMSSDEPRETDGYAPGYCS